MIGTVGLKELEIHCIVGIHPHEREAEQVLRVDAELDMDFSDAAAQDSVDQTVDYDRVGKVITALAVDGRFQLIETLVERAASEVLALFPRVIEVRLEVRKPAAVPAAACSFVRIARSRLRE